MSETTNTRIEPAPTITIEAREDVKLPALTNRAFLRKNGKTVRTPHTRGAPAWATWPLILLAACATVIASQAVISGAFSLTRQAIQLGFLPRREIRHTSDHAIGQVYIPRTNGLLLGGVALLVLGFRSSGNLASAYGISVVGAMTIDSILALVVAATLWKWRLWVAIPVFATFILVDTVFLSANLVKIPEGGWFPILIASGAFAVMFVWRKGRRVVVQALYGDAMPVANFIKALVRKDRLRNEGTAVFLTGNVDVVPSPFLHNIKHNGVVHDRVVFMTVKFSDVPYECDANRIGIEDVGAGFFKAVLRFGFTETPDIVSERILALLEQVGLKLDIAKTSFFLGRETLLPTGRAAV